MRKIVLVFIQIFILIFTAGCEAYDYSELRREATLVVYTPLDKSIYGPIIKEYEKRMNINVEVHEKTQEELSIMAKEDKAFSCDFILGVTEGFLKDNEEDFQAVEYFSYYSMVIFYNTEVVSYKEAPVSFDSLIHGQWKDKIAFLDPKASAIYSEVITFGESISKVKDYIGDIKVNIENKYLSSIDEISQEVALGDYYIGVVTQDKANELIMAEENIAYISSAGSSCTIYDLAVIPKDTKSLQAAKRFMNFILSEDVQEFMGNYLYCKPADKSFGGDRNE
ncbi:extracellular solute-binding protein [Alloiococcus sp. CFN-8]|uniref:extracellular solute-binding protein n=1 Tax=Alloiococcus sp. CFN-8 TaxID=3416081 RepID=UPI003CF08B94